MMFFLPEDESASVSLLQQSLDTAQRLLPDSLGDVPLLQESSEQT